jgi:hypothetical protein
MLLMPAAGCDNSSAPFEGDTGSGDDDRIDTDLARAYEDSNDEAT